MALKGCFDLVVNNCKVNFIGQQWPGLGYNKIVLFEFPCTDNQLMQSYTSGPVLLLTKLHILTFGTIFCDGYPNVFFSFLFVFALFGFVFFFLYITPVDAELFLDLVVNILSSKYDFRALPLH